MVAIEGKETERSAAGGLSDVIVLKRIIAGLLAACMLLIAGCSKTEIMALYFLTEGAPGSFDPQIVGDVTAETVVRNVYEGLVRIGADGKVLPAAAESWEVSADGRVYTFRLRADGCWHLTGTAAEALEGKLPADFPLAVTAADFAFALRRALDPATGCESAAQLINIKNAAAVLAGEASADALGVTADGNRLVIELEQPQETFLQLLTQPMCMPCSETFFNACGGRYGRKIRYILSNGALFMTRFDETGCRLAKNPDYRGAFPAAADVIWLNTSAGVEEKLTALSQDERSGAFLPADVLDEVKQNDKTQVLRVPDGMRGLLFNCAHPLLADPLLREAIVRAADLDPLCETFAQPRAAHALPACVGGTEALTRMYDEAAAKQALARVLEKQGAKTLSLTLLCEQRFDTAMRRMLQTWQRVFGIGLNISVQALDAETLSRRVQSGEYALAFCSFRANSAVAADFAQQILSAARADAAAAETVTDGLRYADPNAAAQALRTAERAMAAMFVFLPVWEEDTCFYCSENVRGVQILPGGVVYYNGAVLAP